MGQDRQDKQQKRQKRNDYWRMAWQKRPRPELYSRHRVTDPLLIAFAQFLISV
jgi:hypothetical protein